ncbi:MAG: hypothetical protein JW702_01595 [Clostridiales bacterium]|nr:hypothetical protein [Clostridiales bacterium]
MDYSDNTVGLPKRPKVLEKAEKVNPPKKNGKKKTDMTEFEHTWELVYHFLVVGVRNLKKMIKLFIIPLGIAMAINIVLESIPTYSLQGIIRPIAFFFIFITASYNSLIPRTLFWVIVFTIGKKLVVRIKKEGFSKTFGSLKNLPGSIRNSMKVLEKSSLFILIASTGFGFVAANYLTRNNRFDKVSVIILLVIALMDTLSRGNKTTLFTAMKLIHKDLAGIARKKPNFTDNHVYLTISGFSLGLLGNLIFGVIKFDFGGYILGGILLAVGLALVHTRKNGVKAH